MLCNFKIFLNVANFNKFSKITLNLNFEKFWRIFKFIFKFFNKFLKIFKKLFDEFIFAECLSKPKFWRRHCKFAVQDFSGIHV